MDITPHKEIVNEEIDDYLKKKKEDIKEDEFTDKPAGGKRKVLMIGAAILVALLAIAFYSYSKGHASFATEKVSVSIDVPADLVSGEETSFTISCKNDNNVALKDAKLEIFFPDNFTIKSSDKTIDHSGSAYYWYVSDIEARSTMKIRIYGSAFGQVGDAKNFRAVLSYVPANFNSTFQSEGSAEASISSTPIALELTFPDSIKDSSESDFVFDYKNKSSRDFEKAKLVIEFPANFVFTSSEPALVKEIGSKNTYSLEESGFKEDTRRTVKVRGSFQSQSEKETVTAKVYLMEENKEMAEYAEASKDIKMEKTDILLYQTINGYTDYSASKNEELSYRITFKNQSGKELKGLMLKSVLGGNFDLATLRAEKGTVKGNEIVWSAANVPALGQLLPSAEASVEFKVKVLDRFTVEKDADKNFILDNTATISSFNGGSETVIVKNEIGSKVKAFIYLDAKGYFNDDGRITNGGSLPPKMGEKTYYTIHWSLRNYFNDTENVRVAATLPGGVKWTGKYIDAKGAVRSVSENDETKATADGEKIAEERVFYDKTGNSVIWELPGFRANDGVLTSAKEIVFQIELTPGVTNVGSIMTLLDAASVFGYDTFTQGNIAITGTAITTDLTDTDFSISDAEAIVRD